LSDARDRALFGRARPEGIEADGLGDRVAGDDASDRDVCQRQGTEALARPQRHPGCIKPTDIQEHRHEPLVLVGLPEDALTDIDRDQGRGGGQHDECHKRRVDPAMEACDERTSEGEMRYEGERDRDRGHPKQQSLRQRIAVVEPRDEQQRECCSRPDQEDRAERLELGASSELRDARPDGGHRRRSPARPNAVRASAAWRVGVASASRWGSGPTAAASPASAPPSA
jgi:hypothetical protein